MTAVVKRKNRQDWVFNWDGQHYTKVTHYGNRYRLSLDRGVKVEMLVGNGLWRHDSDTDDTVRPTEVIFSL
jgi:hypothetical protein